VKGRSRLFLVLVIILAAGLSVIAYFGIGNNQFAGVGNIRQGLDLVGGVAIVYGVQDFENPTTADMNAAISLIRRRLERYNHMEAEVALQGTDQIRVDIPGVDNPEEAISALGATALLTFRDEEGNILVTGDDVRDANRVTVPGQHGTAGSFAVELQFTSEGTQRFAEATSANIGRPLAIFLDEEPISAPVVENAITDGTAVITGVFTAEEAATLARSIREGSLPFALEVLSVNNVGARLGAGALNQGILAGLIGTSLVLIFMLFVYRICGLAADIALVMYVGLLLIFLSMFGVTLTLPGIAGIILSIGMAVDANVVIFERIREEITAGRSLKAAIDAGFKRAFPAIVDSNITTIIAAVVLFWLGTGPVRGFAQTLTIGIIISMFTALVVTRFIIKNMVGAGIGTPAMFIPVKKEA